MASEIHLCKHACSGKSLGQKASWFYFRAKNYKESLMMQLKVKHCSFSHRFSIIKNRRKTVSLPDCLLFKKCVSCSAHLHLANRVVVSNFHSVILQSNLGPPQSLTHSLKKTRNIRRRPGSSSASSQWQREMGRAETKGRLGCVRFSSSSSVSQKSRLRPGGENRPAALPRPTEVRIQGGGPLRPGSESQGDPGAR